MTSKPLGVEDICRHVNRRPPYLMLDRAELQPQQARAVKCVSIAEPWFAGHFPQQPILPGVLQVEAMVQLAELLLSCNGELAGRRPVLAGGRRIKFRGPVLPGDLMAVEVSVAAQDDHWQVDGEVSVNGESRCVAQLQLQLVDPESLQPSRLETPGVGENPEQTRDVQQIEAIIPHRPPFLLIDRVLDEQVGDDGMTTLSVLKNITANDPVFAGMKQPIMPAIFLVEVGAQAGCAYMLGLPQHRGKLGFFAAIDRFEMRRTVVPGDQVVVKIRSHILKEPFGTGDSRVFLAGEEIGSAKIKFALMEKL